MKNCAELEAQLCLKTIQPQDKKKRLFVFGGIWAAITAFVFTKTNTLFYKAQASTTESLILGQASLDFLKETREIKNYLIQINQLKIDLFKNAQQKHPKLAAQIFASLNEDFWMKHQERLIQAFYEDIRGHLSEQETQETLDFFKTKAGQKYLAWKDLIHSRDSHLYTAFKKMNDEIGFHYNNIIVASEQKIKTTTEPQGKYS